MSIRSLKFGFPFIIYAGAFHSFQASGWIIFLPILFSFGLIPIVELLTRPNTKNLDTAEEEIVRNDKLYDYWLYLVVPVQYLALWAFLASVTEPGLYAWERLGRVAVMGLLCGIFGINVAHELGHRANSTERFLAKALLLTSLYLHFYIEHNKGHHKRVSTPEDPASARRGEQIYRFYVRTIWMSYVSAWEIAARDMRRKGLPPLQFRNEMLQFQLIQCLFLLGIGLLFGVAVVLAFLLAAVVGILLLETVNYIEHYGLQRRAVAPGRYERPMPEHSWNSNHVAGRIMLFELSRHSDHHYQANRKYQVLRHHDTSPQMPTGYPGMILLALVPPLWFSVMHKQLHLYHTDSGQEAMISPEQQPRNKE